MVLMYPYSSNNTPSLCLNSHMYPQFHTRSTSLKIYHILKLNNGVSNFLQLHLLNQTRIGFQEENKSTHQHLHSSNRIRGRYSGKLLSSKPRNNWRSGFVLFCFEEYSAIRGIDIHNITHDFSGQRRRNIIPT